MKKVKINDRVLAEGEVTGHSHRLSSSDVFESEDGLREFEVIESDTLTHEEHGPIDLDSGEYLSGRVREINELDEVREVMD